MKDPNSNPILEVDITSGQKAVATGTRNYWICLIKFDELLKGSLLSIENQPDSQLQKMKGEYKRRNQFAERHCEWYAERRGRIQQEQEKCELEADVNDEFKFNALRVSLLAGERRICFSCFQNRFLCDA